MKLKIKKSFPKWKPVEITGSLLNPSEDLDGFVGLEVLESYDSSFLTGHKKTKVEKLNLQVKIQFMFSRIFQSAILMEISSMGRKEKILISRMWTIKSKKYL